MEDIPPIPIICLLIYLYQCILTDSYFSLLLSLFVIQIFSDLLDGGHLMLFLRPFEISYHSLSTFLIPHTSDTQNHLALSRFQPEMIYLLRDSLLPFMEIGFKQHLSSGGAHCH
jgi:hypothetical protein